MGAGFRVLAVAALLQCSAPLAQVSVIDNLAESPNLGGVASLGEGGVGYYGQTFVSPGGALQQAEILVGPNGAGDTKFRFLVVTVSPPTQPDPTIKPNLWPTSVLFESAEIVLPPAGIDLLAPVTIDLGGVVLPAGSTFGILIDAFESLDGIDDGALIGANQSVFQDGLFFYYAVGTGAAPSSRDARFADTTHWIADDLGLDMRFRLSFVSVTDPGSLLQQLLDDVTGVGPGKILERTVAQAQVYYAVPDVQATCAAMRFFDFEVRVIWRLSQATRRSAPWKITTDQMDDLLGQSGSIQIAIGCN